MFYVEHCGGRGGEVFHVEHRDLVGKVADLGGGSDRTAGGVLLFHVEQVRD